MADDTPTPDPTPDAPDDVAVDEAPAPAPAEVVWLRSGTGAHNVAVGSEAYKRLILDGAQPIDGPTADESEVTDFAMLERAKADKPGRR